MDRAALTAAADAAEEALACHRDALTALAEGWRSETGSSATELLQQQCAEATDIVAALRRAAAELTWLNDGWADSGGGAATVRAEGVPTAGYPAAEAPFGPAGIPASGHADADPALPPVPSAAVPAEACAASSWAGQAGGGTWSTAPMSAPPAPMIVPPGGSAPALPDLGGALVGLVAQIAQALGSYTDVPGSGPVESTAGSPPPPDRAEPRPPARHPDPMDKTGVIPPSVPDSAVPKSAVPQPLPLPQPPTVTPPPPPPELLAAERPPDPAVPASPASPPVAVPAPETPPAPVIAAPAQTPQPETPCEIAADELAKAGE